MTERPRILLSFDVEEFDAPQDFGQSVPEAAQFELGAAGLSQVADLLDRLDISATLFTTANFAAHHPDVMRRLAQRHEIASHGYWHSRFELDDLAKSRQTLQKITGQSIDGFRRARLAATDRAAIAAAGYRYNSSENPIWLPGRYNHLFGPRTAYRTGDLLNVPISASPWLRVPLFWLAFKNLPLAVIRHASRRTLRHDGYLNIFFHPWEFIDLAAFPALPWYVRRHSGQAMIDRLESYLRWLAPFGRFSTFSEWLGSRV